MGKRLNELFPGKVHAQLAVPKGFIDFFVEPNIIVEAKLSQTPDGYYQLNRYASDFPVPMVRVIVTQTVYTTIITPERPTYLRSLADLDGVLPGYYVIRYTRKNPWQR